ncbi:MAG: hypothetical protein D6748_15665, partial [Calditrichaeota bacterium]
FNSAPIDFFSQYFVSKKMIEEAFFLFVGKNLSLKDDDIIFQNDTEVNIDCLENGIYRPYFELPKHPIQISSTLENIIKSIRLSDNPLTNFESVQQVLTDLFYTFLGYEYVLIFPSFLNSGDRPKLSLYVIFCFGENSALFTNVQKDDNLCLPQEYSDLILNITSYYFQYTSTALEREYRKISLSSALVGIMSRNASHNIGSHVLSRIATKGIDGWTEGVSIDEILQTYFDVSKRFQLGIHSKIAKDWFEEEGDKFENVTDVIRNKFERRLEAPFRWSKDVQFLSRYIQQRMDFIAQISTEWPDWSEPAYLLKDLLRWFLHQKHLLNYIAASENLGAALFDEQTGKPKPISDEVEGDIRFHVCMVPPDEWQKPANRSDLTKAVEQRIIQIKNGCLHSTSQNQEESVKSDSSKCKKGKTENDDPCEDCHRILLEMPDGKPVQMNDERDVLLAIPGGLVGYHAFYVILENIIRNAAKHGFVRHNSDTKHLDIVIEILHDPDENIGVQIKQTTSEGKNPKRPACLFRIYDNVSLVKTEKNEGVELWGDQGMNTKLGTSIIDETGQLRKEDWGLAEMKIAAGYLQRREILHIGGEEEDIRGAKPNTLPNGKLDEFMKEQGELDTGARAIIRAVKSPIGTLGYEFFVPRPRMVGIVCENKNGK